MYTDVHMTQSTSQEGRWKAESERAGLSIKNAKYEEE